MITDLELGQYFNNLPKDLTLALGDKSYQVNRQYFSYFSKYVKDHLESVIKIPFLDDFDVFPTVLDFIYLKKIHIDHKNDKYLSDLSAILGITQLSDAVKPSLLAPISVDNVVFRIVQRIPANYEDLYQFLSSNIEGIMKSESLPFIPKDIATRVFMDKSASFSSEPSRSIFAVKYCTFHKELAMFFFDKMSEFPIEIVKEGESFEEFIPSLHVTKAMLEKESNLKVKIIESEVMLDNSKNRLEEMKSKLETVLHRKQILEGKLLSAKEDRNKLDKSLSDIINDITVSNQSMKAFYVERKRRILDSLCKCSALIKGIVPKKEVNKSVDDMKADIEKAIIVMSPGAENAEIDILFKEVEQMISKLRASIGGISGSENSVCTRPN